MLSAPTPTEIATDALKLIGEKSINDVSVDAAALEEALHWLDLAVSELAGTRRAFWLIPATLEIPLQADKIVYDLVDDVSNATKPTNGVQFPIRAWVRDAQGNRGEVEIIRRTIYENIGDPSTSGPPSAVTINRQPGNPTATIYPVPGLSGVYTLELLVQSYSPDFVDSCQTGDPSFLLGPAWGRWGAYQTASDIGAGPVRKVSDGELQRITGVAELALTRLLAFENTAHRPATSRRVKFQDLG